MDKVAIANYVFYANVFLLQLKNATFRQKAQKICKFISLYGQ